MGLPAYLYHGSPYLFKTLVPQQSMGGSGMESLCAVYAAETFREVIPFALPFRWHPDAPGGKLVRNCDSGISYLEYGSINPAGVGYVYKLKAEGFRKIDGWQWVSPVPVGPVEITKIKVRDYWKSIVFSEEARRICEELYGANLL
jgi:hypothetical protein